MSAKDEQSAGEAAVDAALAAETYAVELDKARERAESKTALGAGLIPVPPGRKRYTLPSGAIADVRPGKGRDLRQAGRFVNENSDAMTYEFALIVLKTLINGREITVEELDDMTQDDAGHLLQIMRGKALSDIELAQKKAAAARAKPETSGGDSSPQST